VYARHKEILALARQGVQPRLIHEKIGQGVTVAHISNLLRAARVLDPTIPSFRGGRLAGENYHLPKKSYCKRNTYKPLPDEEGDYI